MKTIWVVSCLFCVGCGSLSEQIKSAEDRRSGEHVALAAGDPKALAELVERNKKDAQKAMEKAQQNGANLLKALATVAAVVDAVATDGKIMQAIRGVDEKVGEAKTEMNEKIDGVDGKVGEAKTDMNEKIDGVESGVNSKIENIENRLDREITKLLDRFKDDLATLTKQHKEFADRISVANKGQETELKKLALLSQTDDGEFRKQFFELLEQSGFSRQEIEQLQTESSGNLLKILLAALGSAGVGVAGGRLGGSRGKPETDAAKAEADAARIAAGEAKEAANRALEVALKK